MKAKEPGKSCIKHSCVNSLQWRQSNCDLRSWVTIQQGSVPVSTYFHLAFKLSVRKGVMKLKVAAHMNNNATVCMEPRLLGPWGDASHQIYRKMAQFFAIRGIWRCQRWQRSGRLWARRYKPHQRTSKISRIKCVQFWICKYETYPIITLPIVQNEFRVTLEDSACLHKTRA